MGSAVNISKLESQLEVRYVKYTNFEDKDELLILKLDKKRAESLVGTGLWCYVLKGVYDVYLLRSRYI